MRLPLNLSISKTHLLAHKKQTIVAMLGVTFGIAMFLLMISFMQGVNQFLEDTMLNSTPDIHIYNDVKTDYAKSIAGENYKDNPLIMLHHPKPKQVMINIKNADGILKDIKASPEVIAVSPQLSTQVFYNYGPVQVNGLINGVNILEEAKLFNIPQKMVEGKTENLLTADNGIIMGKGLSKKLNVHSGDLVLLATPEGHAMRFRIVGLFQFGVGLIDNSKSYVNLAAVQQLLGKDRSYITDINVKLKNNTQAKNVAVLYYRKYNYKSEDWQTANASVMASNVIRDVLTYIVSITMLVVAGFGIYNIMNMTIANKLKDIAILKSQGFTGNDIVQIFLSQSLIIGLIGSLAGLLLGFFFSYTLSRTRFPSDNDFMPLKYFPVVFKSWHYLFGIFFGLLTTLVAGLMPSLKAAKTDPVAILRG